MDFVRGDWDNLIYVCVVFFFVFKQKTAYDMRISDWSSDVCSSDLFDQLQGTQPKGQTGQCSITGPPGVYLSQRVIQRTDGHWAASQCKIGRESCRERVCQYV